MTCLNRSFFPLSMNVSIRFILSLFTHTLNQSNLFINMIQASKNDLLLTQNNTPQFGITSVRFKVAEL